MEYTFNYTDKDGNSHAVSSRYGVTQGDAGPLMKSAAAALYALMDDYPNQFAYPTDDWIYHMVDLMGDWNRLSPGALAVWIAKLLLRGPTDSEVRRMAFTLGADGADQLVDLAAQIKQASEDTNAD